MTTTMKLNVQHLNLRPVGAVHSWVARQLSAIGQVRQIDAANIRLTRLENASPAYQVNVHLVTPGPDVFAESRDHTLPAAFAKAMAQLKNVITSRAAKRLKKFKSNLKARRGG